jgi:nucleoside-diphosphate-sugar epimerase
VVYGPNRDQGLTAAITHALRAAVLGIAYMIPFGGPIDLQYVDDVAWSFIRAALAEPDGAPVFDLHGDLTDVAAVVALIEREAPEAAGLISHRAEPVPGRVEFDDAPLRAFAGELPKTSLSAGIRTTLELFRRQRDAGLLTEGDLPAPSA